MLALLWGCTPPSACAIGGTPESVDTFVEHLNTLEGPIDTQCIVASLARPLRVAATTNRLSAQPANGRRSPRIFLFSGPLAISVVPDGIGSTVVELGERVNETHSLKGELALPIVGSVPADGPYRKVATETGTICAGCHPGEEAVETAGGTGFVSRGIRAEPTDVVDLDTLQDEAIDCEAFPDLERCQVLTTLFDGAVEPADFPDAFPSIFDL